ncbi:MAG: preprotein translocase subunit SecE, partial [Patescibacteria group bacterium]
KESFFMIGKIMSFLSEAFGELKKVVWPSRSQTTRLTLTVLAITFVVAGLVAGLDYFFNQFLSFLVER